MVLRTDFRRVSFGRLCEPYNLMLKNWPRLVEAQLNSYEIWADLFSKECQGLADSTDLKHAMRTELGTMSKSLDVIATQVITGLEEVIKLESPFPPKYQELLCQAFRHSPSSDYNEILTNRQFDEIIHRLTGNGTLCLTPNIA
ncbi:MAG: hypothetical protein PVG63_03885 [Anaerolineales bacterium]